MATAKEGIKQKVRGWSHHDSADLYGIDDWGNGYFRISKKGEVTVRLNDEDGGKKDVSLCDLLEGLKERGTTVPVLFRFRDLLRSRIAELNDSFRKAIEEAGYQGKYQGVYPIKVNQQRQVVEEIAEFGTKYDYGLEAGSKPELIAAMAHMHNPNAYLICNGYKDDEFIDLALTAQKMGLNIFIVLEMPSELDVIMERARRMDIRPNLGVRFKLAAKGSGLWQESAGDKSVFGLNAAQVVDVVDKLKQVDALDCLKLLHYHQGSQIPNISVVREGLTEAVRIYVDLVKEGVDNVMEYSNAQFVVLGSGDLEYENYFKWMQEKYPGRFVMCLGFVPELSRKIYAGADIFLMPSKSEPCGLSQMIALRYGTIPVVRETGGLKDSITDSGDGKGNGFTFKTYNAHDMLGAIRRSLGAYSDKKYWASLVERALECDNSWGRSAREYMRLYRETIGK